METKTKSKKEKKNDRILTGITLGVVGLTALVFSPQIEKSQYQKFKGQIGDEYIETKKGFSIDPVNAKNSAGRDFYMKYGFQGDTLHFYDAGRGFRKKPSLDAMVDSNGETYVKGDGPSSDKKIKENEEVYLSSLEKIPK
jgi:hypothetical protein